MDADVIVLGAGAAGLAAARDLQRAGKRVLVLEARGRIGGRIFTSRSAPEAGPIELGAEFVHGKPREIFEIIESAKLRVTEVADRRLLSENGQLRLLDDFWKIIETVDRQIDPARDLAYEEFLRGAKASSFEKRIARSYVEGFDAARADVIGSAGVALEAEASEKVEGDKLFRVAEGYDRVMEELARELPAGCIKLGCVVEAVNWGKGCVELIGNREGKPFHFRARRGVITLPLGVLRATVEREEGVRFEPVLAPKQEAIKRLEMGQVVRISLQFREPFWRKREVIGDCGDFGFTLCLEAEFPTWWTQQPQGENVLVGWAGGPAAERLRGRTRDELRAAALRSLGQTFGLEPGAIEQGLVRLEWHDWSQDPFSRGAYSYPAVGGIEAARELAKPLEETLFFAGEATDAKGFHGTVHGAIESGYRAAREILAAH